MDERRRLSLVVGLFLLAALGVGAFALLSLGTSTGLLEGRYRLITYFEDVQGLVAGAPVRLAGRDVGQVEFVTFSSQGDQRPPVRVVLQIRRDVQDRAVPQTDTGGQDEYSKALERTQEKELGKFVP